MGLDRRFAEKEGGRDLAVGDTPSDEGQDFELAFGEIVEAARRRCVGWWAVHEVLDQTARERRGEESVAGGDGTDAGDELVAGHFLAEEMSITATSGSSSAAAEFHINI